MTSRNARRRRVRTTRNAQQDTTWPIAGDQARQFTPPPQGRPRAVVLHRSGGGSDDLADLERLCKPGTYLIESGTHPSIQGPMGLYGILVVTTAPTPGTTAGSQPTPGTAYPA